MGQVFVPMTTQMTFSDISKICMIDQDMYQTTFGYAPDKSRWKTVLEKKLHDEARHALRRRLRACHLEQHLHPPAGRH